MNERNSRVADALRAEGVDPEITGMLARKLGASDHSKADPALVRTATGQVIGGVAPTGAADSVLPLNYQQLLTITKGIGMQVR